MRTKMDVDETAPESRRERYVSIPYKGDFQNENIARPCIDAIEAELMNLGYTTRSDLIHEVANTDGQNGVKIVAAWGLR